MKCYKDLEAISSYRHLSVGQKNLKCAKNCYVSVCRCRSWWNIASYPALHVNRAAAFESCIDSPYSCSARALKYKSYSRALIGWLNAKKKVTFWYKTFRKVLTNELFWRLFHWKLIANSLSKISSKTLSLALRLVLGKCVFYPGLCDSTVHNRTAWALFVLI